MVSTGPPTPHKRLCIETKNPVRSLYYKSNIERVTIKNSVFSSMFSSGFPHPHHSQQAKIKISHKNRQHHHHSYWPRTLQIQQATAPLRKFDVLLVLSTCAVQVFWAIPLLLIASNTGIQPLSLSWIGGLEGQNKCIMSVHPRDHR